MSKKLIKLTENDLHKIIKESVKKILYESNIYPNNESDNILNIVNTAIANSTFDIPNYKLKATKRESYMLTYDGYLCFEFYYDDSYTDSVTVTVSIGAEYFAGEERSFWSPGFPDECNAWLKSVDNIELNYNNETLNIKDNDLMEKLYDIIENKLHDYLNDEAYELIIKDIEDYNDYMDFKKTEYYEGMNDR